MTLPFLMTWALLGSAPPGQADFQKTLTVGPGSVVVKSPLRVGLSEAVTVRLTFAVPAKVGSGGFEVRWPVIDDKVGSSNLLELGQSSPDPLPNNMVGWQASMRLEPTKLGPLKLGDVTVLYNDPDNPGKPDQIALTLPEVTVIKGPTSTKDPDKLRDGPLSPPAVGGQDSGQGESTSSLKNLLFWGGVGVLLLVVAIGFLLFLKSQIEQPELPQGPLGKALRRLDDLPSARVLGTRPAVDAIMDVVRQYLHDRYQLDAPRQTTPEFARDPTVSEVLGRARQSSLTTFLTVADARRFEAEDPTPDEADDIRREALAFLRREQQQMSQDSATLSHASSRNLRASQADKKSSDGSLADDDKSAEGSALATNPDVQDRMEAGNFDPKEIPSELADTDLHPNDPQGS